MTAKENKEKLAEIAMHPMTLKIVAMTIGRSMTVQELSERLGISMVAGYKIIENLAELGFLAEAGKVRTSTHGRALSYTSIVKNGYINIRDGCIEVCCNYKDGYKCFQEDYLFEDEPSEDDEPDAVVEIHLPKPKTCRVKTI